MTKPKPAHHRTRQTIARDVIRRYLTMDHARDGADIGPPTSMSTCFIAVGNKLTSLASLRSLILGVEQFVAGDRLRFLLPD